MQFTFNALAILAASANMATAVQPKRYQAYRPAAYENTVPWTSSTCSTVYSTLMAMATKPVTSVITTTTFKPSTWTSTKPTVVTSVYTTFKPATTTLTRTVTSVYVVTSTKTSTSVVTSSTVLTRQETSSSVICKTVPIVSPVTETSTEIKTQTLPYVTPCTGKPYTPNYIPYQFTNFLNRNHHFRYYHPINLPEPLPGNLVGHFIHHGNRCH